MKEKPSPPEQYPYDINATHTVAVVAWHHHLIIIVGNQTYLLNNPADPPPGITPPTVAVSSADTPDDLRKRLNILHGPITPEYRLFNQMLNTYIATEALREEWREKWISL